MGILKIGQTELMLILSGVCLMVTVVTLFSRFESRHVKVSLIAMELISFLLLRFNRLGILYTGDVSELGFRMTYIANFAVLLLLLLELTAFNSLLAGFLTEEQGKNGIFAAPKRLMLADMIFAAGLVLLVINLFTGFIYSISEANTYVRGKGFALCNMLFLAAMLLQASVVISDRTKLRRTIRYAMLAYTGLVIGAAVVQFFHRGLSLNTISFACFSLLLHVCAVYDSGKRLEEAQKREIEALEGQEKLLRRVLRETAGALAGAIDAKDPYTSGHSQRVAGYAREIARRAGKDEDECARVYFAGLLHDVGKIGVPGAIINKPGRLTDEEFAVIKQHPAIGDGILAGIEDVPYLHTAALDHHERYDGRGYPNGLKGDQIPEYARIIAVADAYDAMTSNRSYRSLIPQEQVRAEIEKGRGTQFDPAFADCMLQMIDEDQEYTMHE